MKQLLKIQSITVKLISSFLLLFMFPITLSFGNDDNITENKTDSANQIKHVIKNVEYKITGVILEAALEGNLNIENGTREFSSEDYFLRYIKNKSNKLTNIRALETTSNITFTKEYNANKNQYDVSITVYAKAGLTFIALPYFKYSSNSGFLLSARARDYNFLGSLETFSINFNYVYDNEKRHGGSIDFGFQYPWKINQHILKLQINEGIQYRSDNSLKNDTTLGVHHHYPLTDLLSINSSFLQSFNTATDTDKANQPIFSSGKNTIKTGISALLTPNIIPIIQNITYSLDLATIFQYSLTPNDPEPNERQNITPSINHRISLGQINEKGNFRQGISLTLGNNNAYSTKDRRWNNSLYIESKGHFTAGNIFGLDARLYGVQNFYTYLPNSKPTDDIGSNVGDKLRGVLDNDFKHAQNAFTLNVTALIKAITFSPFFDFHLGLFSDIGVRSRSNNKPFSAKEDFKATLGVEVLTFALFARSIILRISYGVDITKAIRVGKLERSNREIFIGLSRYF